MKTNELTGAALDWAVAKAIGEYKPVAVPAYSSDWSQGGPIIEREKIGIWPPDEAHPYWTAGTAGVMQTLRGPTPLIAAMRCYCCAKLGDEIDIPEEICQQQNS